MDPIPLKGREKETSPNPKETKNPSDNSSKKGFNYEERMGKNKEGGGLKEKIVSFIKKGEALTPYISYIIFFGIFFYRLLSLFYFSYSPLFHPSNGDMFFYENWAENLLQGRGGFFSEPHAYYGLPGYPYVVSLLYRVFGVNPFLPGVLQAACEAGTGLIIFRIAKTTFFSYQTQIGIISSLIFLLFLPAQAYSVILMPTAIGCFVFYFLLLKIIETKGVDKKTDKRFFLYGMLAGITTTIIASILPIVVMLLGCLIFTKNKPQFEVPQIGQKGYKETKKKGKGGKDKSGTGGKGKDRSAHLRISASLLLLSGFFLATGFCWVHNVIIARDMVFLSAHDGVNLWIGNNPNANGYPKLPVGLEKISQQGLLSNSLTQGEKMLDNLGEEKKRGDVSRYWKKQAVDYVSNNRGEWLKLEGKKFLNFWSAFEYDDLGIISILKKEGIIGISLGLGLGLGVNFGMIALLAIPGIIFSIKEKNKNVAWLLIALFFNILTMLSTFVTERYREIAAPTLIIFASYYAVSLYYLIREGGGENKKEVAIYLSPLLLSFLLVYSPLFIFKDEELNALEPYNTGEKALEVGDLELAEKKLIEAYKAVPDNAEINFALGNLSLEEDNKRIARKFYIRTLELDPKHKGALNNLGFLSFKEGKLKEAEDEVRGALELEPDSSSSRELLEEIREKRKKE